MKKLIAKIFIFLFSVCLLQGVVSASKEKIEIVTTTSNLKSIAEFIGKDKVEVLSLTNGFQDPHFIDPKPSFMLKARKADLWISVGMQLEISWESLIIEGSRNPKIRTGSIGYLDVSNGITPLDVPQTVDRSMGDVHPSGNPHYWLDPLNAKVIAGNITKRLSEISPQDKAYFEQNLSDFNKRIDQKIIGWKKELENLKGKDICVYHRSWPYFAQSFGLQVACELEPKPGIAPSPGHLKEVIETVKQKNIKIILMEVFYDEKPARFVSQQTGAKVVVVPNSVGGAKDAKDYFSLMDAIIGKIVEAMQR